MRSRLPRVEFITIVPLVSCARVDAEERQVAENGSLMILNASAANGSSSSALRSSSLSLSGLMPLTGGMSSGDGR